eukprot:gene1387-2760_t
MAHPGGTIEENVTKATVGLRGVNTHADYSIQYHVTPGDIEDLVDQCRLALEPSHGLLPWDRRSLVHLESSQSPVLSPHISLFHLPPAPNPSLTLHIRLVPPATPGPRLFMFRLDHPQRLLMSQPSSYKNSASCCLQLFESTFFSAAASPVNVFSAD